MNLNRNQQPGFKTIDHIDIPAPDHIKLDNEIDTFIINAGTQNVVKIDIMFNAGSWYQDKPLIASTVNEMLIEGTKNQNSQQIAEKLDFYGAYISCQPTKDFANITLYTLKKHLAATIQILEDIIKNPVFPEHELTTFLNKRKQKFQIELEKVSSVARREFNEQIFGENHPYGIKAKLSDYENVVQPDIIKFYTNFYNSDNCKIIISGKADNEIIDMVNKFFGQNPWNNKSNILLPGETPFPKQNTKSFVEKPNATQTAIRIGKVTINKNHNDYHKLNVVNTILGGYFGSRLMKNIREEKGYTYGINSVLVSLKNAGYFVILSEVGANVSQNAINDILEEVKKLREVTISEDELNLVKNYMLGDLLRSFDGAFEISSSFRNIIESDLNMSFYQNAIDTIKSITPNDIKSIAGMYLREDSFTITVVGKYN